MTRREEYEAKTEQFLLPLLAEHQFRTVWMWSMSRKPETGI